MFRELSRLGLIGAGETKGELRLPEEFHVTQKTIHVYLDNGFVRGPMHCWCQLVLENPMKLSTAICQSLFCCHCPVFRDYCVAE